MKVNQYFILFLIVLRLDQWLVMEKHLTDLFKIEKDYYYSILPTATPYARNALFAGLYPSDIEKYYPNLMGHPVMMMKTV
ncbi:MAG: PglZ domain-containing protein [Ignavibacteriales bacterium]|nr:PglZ domain-containing protein [Ignavibacteriales bacterium]